MEIKAILTDRRRTEIEHVEKLFLKYNKRWRSPLFPKNNPYVSYENDIDDVDNPYSADDQERKKVQMQYADNVYAVQKDQYLTEFIGDKYKAWLPGNSILFNCSCGAGKTTFVCNTLPYFIKKGYKVLYVASRIDLLRQTKIAVAKSCYPKYKDYPNECLDECTTFDDRIFFTSYQKLGGIYGEKSVFRSDVFNEKAKVVLVVDEAHWFTEDCTFSYDPNIVLKPFLKQFENAIKLFITATDWDCISTIGDCLPHCEERKITFTCQQCYRESQIGYYSCGNYNCNNPKCIQCDMIQERNFFYLPPSFDYPAQHSFQHCYFGSMFDSNNVSAFSYDNEDDLISVINKAPENEKWLIYVESKANGRRLEEKIKDAEFVFSENDGERMNDEAKAEKQNIVINKTLSIVCLSQPLYLIVERAYVMLHCGML